MDALESLFKVAEAKAAAKAAAGGGGETVKRVELIEHRRAHNICIELAGIRLPFASIKTALTTMECDGLSPEQLTALGRAVPEESERRAVASYLAGDHPRHKGVSDPALLGTVERYFAEVMDIPRLGPRIAAVAFARGFDATASRAASQLALLADGAAALTSTPSFDDLLAAVLALGNALNAGTHRGGAAGFRLDTLLKLADVKGADRKTSLLHFVLGQMVAAEDKKKKEGGADDATTPTTPPRSSVRTLSSDMAVVKAAAQVQVGAVKALISEAKAGLAAVDAELVLATEAAAAADDADSDPRSVAAAAAHRAFADAMAGFATRARDALAGLDADAEAAFSALEKGSQYLGEPHDASDPTRTLRIVASFLGLLDRAHGELAKAAAVEAAREAREAKRAELERRVRDASDKSEAADDGAKRAKARGGQAAPSPGGEASKSDVEAKAGEESATPAVADTAASPAGDETATPAVTDAPPPPAGEEAATPAAADAADGAVPSPPPSVADAPPPEDAPTPAAPSRPPPPPAKPVSAASTPVAVRASAAASGRVFAPPPPPPPLPPKGGGLEAEVVDFVGPVIQHTDLLRG